MNAALIRIQKADAFRLMWSNCFTPYRTVNLQATKACSNSNKDLAKVWIFQALNKRVDRGHSQKEDNSWPYFFTCNTWFWTLVHFLFFLLDKKRSGNLMGRGGNERHTSMTLLHIHLYFPLDLFPGLKKVCLNGRLSVRALAKEANARLISLCRNKKQNLELPIVCAPFKTLVFP